MARSIAKSPIQADSGITRMFGCWPRHHARMLVPERGEPTTKIGLFISPSIGPLQTKHDVMLPNFRSPRHHFIVEGQVCNVRVGKCDRQSHRPSAIASFPTCYVVTKK